MGQPPDERRPPPGEAPAEPLTDDQATVAWTPPEPAALEPTEVTTPDPETPDPETPDPVTPEGSASPLISWAPSGTPPTAGASGTSGGPIVGWQVPDTPPAPVGVDGYVIATVWARLVAYSIDALLIAVIPSVLGLLTTDFGGLMREAIEASRAGGTAVITTPVTLAAVLISVVTVGLNFLYFVGFWTGTGQATLGMRGLRMRVVDAAGGRTLTMAAAIRRWIALGAPLTLLAIIPPLQSTAGIAGLLLSIVILITVATDPLRQGLHDKWAGSVVIRSVSSGAGATAVGCLVLCLVVGAVGVVVGLLAAAEMLPQIEEFLREMEAVP